MKIKHAVVDTNVLISAALSARSVPASLVDFLLQHGRLAHIDVAIVTPLEALQWISNE